MSRMISRWVGNRAVQGARRSGWLDFRRGANLFRDPSVPIGPKLFSASVGLAATAVIQVLEIPVEGAIAVLAPGLGLALDVLFDGVEWVILPFLIGSCVLNLLRRSVNSVVLPPKVG